MWGTKPGMGVVEGELNKWYHLEKGRAVNGGTVKNVSWP